jgi:mannose-1-phosphate guanylyltransferase
VVDGERTLLQAAVARAEKFVDPGHVVAVVSSQHRKWWEPQLDGVLHRDNVVVQPLARGTAVGVLLPLCRVLARDPGAHLVFLPADHWFRNEDLLAGAVRTALEFSYGEPGSLVFVGIEPESPTGDFGYLVPLRKGGSGPQPVVSFVEKPSRESAKELIGRGALWNTLIFTAHGRYLMRVIREHFPHTVDAVRVAVSGSADDAHRLARALAAVYPSLTTIDFSRDVLEHSEVQMAVIPVTGAGWLELGTPARLEAWLAEIRPARVGMRQPKPVAERPASMDPQSDSVTVERRDIKVSPPE